MWKPVVAVCAAAVSFAAVAAPTFESITLGAAEDLTLFNMGATTFSASNGSTLFQGNIGLAAGSMTNVSGGGTLTGTLYVDPGATLQSNFYSQFNVNGGTVVTSLAQARADVIGASANAALLTPTQTWSGNLTEGTTFTSSGDFNVINILGDITVTTSSKNVIFSGDLDDHFIVNVFGSITVSNGSIGVIGGLAADHLLINVLGSGEVVTLTNGTSSLYGTYLDVNGKITLAPGTVYGSIMANQIKTSSGPSVFGDTYTPPIPEPETYALLLAGLGMLGFVARRRKRPAAQDR